MKQPQEPRNEAEMNLNTNTADKPEKRLSDKELADLMGTNRDTYTRRRGSVRKR